MDEIFTRKISKSEAKELHKDLIQAETNALNGEKSSDIRKYNILNILNNVGSVLSVDTYLHHKDVPKETLFEKSIVEKNKLRRQRLDEIERKEENINNELFKE